MNNGRKAVFLDRDGVLIHDVHYLSDLSDIHFYPDVPDGLKRLQDEGYLLIVVTNQSGVARGYFPLSFVNECHQEMNRFLSEQVRITLNHLYFCPHHPDGYPPYNEVCECRKPSPGLVLRAQQELYLNLNRSFMIGDKLSDIEMGRNAGVSSILVTTGQGFEAVEPVRRRFHRVPILDSFTRAVDWICQQND